MQTASFATYLLVFLSVLVPFLLADVVVRLPRIDRDKIPGFVSLPRLARLALPLVVWSTDLFGRRLADLRPARTEELRRMLVLAGSSLEPAMFIGLRIAYALLGIAAGVLVFALSGSPPAALVVGGFAAVAGVLLPPAVLRDTAERRRIAILKALPFSVDLVSAAMHAGLDFMAAVRYYVSLGVPGPLSAEFALMLRENELGTDRVEALRRMADRVRTPEFTAFADAVAHGLEVGASLVETMRMQGEDLRRARFHLAEEKAARAPALMIFPLAIFIVPAVFAVILVPVIMRFRAARGG